MMCPYVIRRRHRESCACVKVAVKGSIEHVYLRSWLKRGLAGVLWVQQQGSFQPNSFSCDDRIDLYQKIHSPES